MRKISIIVALFVACTRPRSEPPTESPQPVAAQSDAKGAPQSFEAGDGRFGYRDASGREILPARYHAAMEFAPTGVAFVVDDEGWACIDVTGSVRLRPFVFDNGPDYPSEGVFRYVEGDRMGFADDACRPTITAAWAFAGPFAEQRAPVCRGCAPAHGEHAMPNGGKWGFVDPSGREVIAAEWDFVFPFAGGVARVERRGVPRKIRLDGTLVPVQSAVRVVDLSTKDRAGVLAALRERRESIAGCADEYHGDAIAVARVTIASAAAPKVVIDPADALLATCFAAALDGVTVPAQLTLRTGDVARESTGELLSP